MSARENLQRAVELLKLAKDSEDKDREEALMISGIAMLGIIKAKSTTGECISELDSVPDQTKVFTKIVLAKNDLI